MTHKAANGQSFKYIQLAKYVSLFATIVLVTFLLCATEEFTFVIDFSRHQRQPILLKEFVPRHNSIYSSTDDWSQVTADIFAYSAYWDSRSDKEPFVRIIAGAKVVDEYVEHVKCLLMINNYTIEIYSNHEILPENHFKVPKAIYFNCLAPIDSVPKYVALVPSNWNKSSNYVIRWITIRNVRINSSAYGIGVCVRPLFKYKDTFRIAEFVAYYEALGAKHFTFYNHDSDYNTKTFFSTLKNKNYTVDFLPWTLPSAIAEMWEMGQIANINDCIYRNMHTVSYIVITDMDEFITPRHEMTLHELLKQQDTSETLASFVIRSSVFCLELEKDDLTPFILPFITQTRIQRENYIYPFNVRSKYILKPKKVIIGGIHYALKIANSFTVKYVQASKVLVHHYRANLCKNNSETIKTNTIDVTSRKYMKSLMKSPVIDLWTRMNMNVN